MKKNIPDTFYQACICYQKGDFNHARSLYIQTLQEYPDLFEALSTLATIDLQNNNPEQAIIWLDRAIAIPSNHIHLSIAYNNRGIALHELKRHSESIQSYSKSIELNAKNAEAYANRGNIFIEINRYPEAIKDYQCAIKLGFKTTDIYLNQANAHRKIGQYKESIDGYKKVIALGKKTNQQPPQFIEGLILHLETCISHWKNFDSSLQNLYHKIENGKPVISGFHFFSVSDESSKHYKVSKIWVETKYHDLKDVSKPFQIHPKKSKKIRIGYFSTDFRIHAVGQIIAELFEQHDKNRFELIGFDFGPRADDALRDRIKCSFDQFIDIRDKSDAEAAQLAREMQIDIAVDLNGFTGDCRPGIFAYRAAPIQVAYIGYPGTMGADFMDYILADKILIPEASQKFYTEKVVYMPDSYQVNDRRRVVADKTLARAELGLPASGFIFCSFNNNNKIIPPTFDSWMRILHQVPNSVLWLFADNPEAENNLRHEAMQRGIPTQRLIFAPRVPLPDHLARHRIADLCLDTFPYTGHATTSNALWVGIPVVTRMGESFASRVAASLLHAIDLPELVTTSQADFEKLAVALAQQPEKLQTIRDKLERNRQTAPLFDPERFTRHLENAYEQMVQRHRQHLPPDHITVTAHKLAEPKKQAEKTGFWGRVTRWVSGG